ncbi:MAG: hypothetical protein C0399_06740 [Syntrophus sp. (in: bacteria)]|nr:hypothetical protein [Syntrophus sp. (in: bacteria)]
MTNKEKVEKLKELFAQADAIDKQILDLVETKTGVATVKDKQKVIKKSPVKSQPTRNQEQEYYCADCKTFFKSKDSKLDAVCPRCKSINIFYFR